ncbi:tetratricopeptide repeat protein [bacterium]|nr:tetratricopeptide repeat protein [candidate division CSSED10-310 bacterium]
MSDTIGIFPVIRKLGEGGMGRIYLVRDPSDGSLWAAKQFKGDLTRPLLVQRFRREFRALESLNHPAIVRVKNLEYSNNQMFFLMEYVNGKSLDRILNQNRKRDVDWIRKNLLWMKYLCDPLEYIHNQQMVHRDLKPGNIMILDSGSATPLKLLDFGVIHWTHADSIITGKPTFFGSLRYMAPEQINSTAPDLRSDLYSFGVILYEAVTGRPPFNIDNPLLLLNMHQIGDPPPPRKINEHVSDNLQDLILTLLSKRPDNRPTSAGEVSEWIDQILSGDVFYRPDGRSSVFSSGKVFQPEFTGRDVEINQLVRFYNHCKNGNLQIVTVHGPAGIGKSRLIQQLLRMPDLALRQICHGTFQADAPPQQGFSKALHVGLDSLKKQQLYAVESSADRFTRLKEQFSEIIQILESGSDVTGVSFSEKSRAANILNLLSELSQDQPLILVLEDIHHASGTDLNLLRHIIELHDLSRSGHESRGFFLILSFRDQSIAETDHFTTFFKWLDTRTDRIDLRVDGLSRYAVSAMITSMLGGSPAPVLAATVYENSEGNPLHIIEILKEVVESHQDIPWLEVGTDDETLAIPAQERLTQILSRRLDRFTPETKRVLFAGAVLGPSFAADELELLCAMPDDLFLEQADVLLRSGILEEDPFQSDTYRFKHAKLQESVLEKISPETANTLHLQAVDVLEKIHTGKLPAIATRLIHHCDICGLTEKKLEYRILASDHADSLGNQIDALEHLEKAIELLDSEEIDPDLKDRQRVICDVKLGSLFRRTGKVDQAESLLMDLLDRLANDENHAALIAKANLQLGSLYGSQGKISLAVEHLNRSLALYNRLNDQEMIIDCYINLGASFNYIRGSTDNLKYSSLAMEKSQLIGDNYRLATAMINLGVAHACNGRGQEGLPYLQRAVEICEMIKSDRLKAFAMMTMASCYLSFVMKPEYARRIVELTDKVIKTVRKTGDVGWLADCLYKRSMANHFLGRPVNEDLDMALSLCEQLGQNSFVEEIMSFKESISGKGDTDDGKMQ